MSSPPLSTPWVLDTNREPPVYTRPLVGSELFLQRYWDTFDADGDVCIGINFNSSLGTDELKERARKALNNLRFMCPIIACAVEDVASPRWVYTPSADREAWLNLAFAVEERGETLNPPEFVERIKLLRLPYADESGTITLFRAYLLTTSCGGRSHEQYGLYFHGPHTIIDAGPALHALNWMCQWISGQCVGVKIEPSQEWRNLAVDPVTATGGPSQEWATAGVELLQEFAEQDARTIPCHTLVPPSRPLIISEPQFRYAISLSASETAAIVTQARKLGVSVSVLFHAAHCLAQLRMNPIPEATEVDFSSPTTVVSLERYMKPPVDPKTHLISCFTMLPWRFSMSCPMMEDSEKARLIMTAKMLQERLDRHLANPCLPHIVVAMQNTPPDQVEQDDTQEKKVPMPPWCCAFNNLGVVEQKVQTQFGNMSVESMCIGVRLRSFMTVHMWTMHSRFHFQVQGATVWGEDYIRTLLDETLKVATLVLDES